MDSTSQPDQRVVDQLTIQIHPDRTTLGNAAARQAAAYLQHVISRQGEARVMFACAPSQNEFLAALVNPKTCGVSIDWERVTAFHMDEYVGLAAQHPQTFRSYLHQHLLGHVPIAIFHPLHAERPDLETVATEYATRLNAAPIDLICLGIGENGHIAFNDPPTADFADPHTVKVVELDTACRTQQVNDGCFATLAEVPRLALTVTIPVFCGARRLSIHVPGERKANAVRATLFDKISTACPATILRTHLAATLYLDADSAGKL